MSEPQTLSYESPPTTLSGIGLGTIALQVVGVYCITQALPIFTVLATYLGTSGAMGRGGGGWQIIFSFMMPVLYFAIGLLLIRFAPRLSVWLFRDSAGVGGAMVGPVTTTAGQNLQAIAFSVIGVMTMISAAPRLASHIWLLLMSTGAPMGGYAQLVEPIVEFLFGLALFLQARGLSILWHKLRAGGVAEPRSIHSDPDKA
jgi:hypothetical protein